jgi:vitamin B12 transporter
VRTQRLVPLNLLLCLLVLTAAVLPAQTRGDTSRVSDIVVTATRVPVSTSTLAAATTVISGDDLRARGITFVMDALRDVPGMTVVQGGSYGAVTSMFLRGGESDYVKVLLDGVPLNVPGGSIDLANLTTTDLDRIEVVRGPASVLYGADAMSGVVQLFTRSGGRTPRGDLSARGGSFGDRDYEAHFSGGTGQLAASVNGASFASDGVYAFNSGYRNTVGSARLTWDGQNRGRVALTVRHEAATAHYPTDFTGALVDHNQLVSERALVLGLDASRPLGTAWTANLQGFASRNIRGSQNRPDSPADTLGYGYDADATARTWRRGGEARVDWRPASATVVSLGLGLERESIEQSSRTAMNFGAGATIERDSFQVSRTTGSGYGQLLLTPLPEVSVQLGTRLDHNSAFGSIATSRAGVSWQAARALRLWTAAGTAFKAPTFFELFAASAFEVGNPALAPERSANVEVGIEQRLGGGRLTIGTTLFAQRFRNLIQYISAPPGEPTYVNLGGARSRGLEVSLGVRMSRSLGLQGRWTWLSTEVTDSGSASTATFAQGKPLLRRPASSGGLTASLRQGRTTLAATINHVGMRDDVDFRDFPSTRTALPSYTTVDVALDFPVGGLGPNFPGLDFTLRAENLFDAAYQQTIGFPGRGRTLLAGARLRFGVPGER